MFPKKSINTHKNKFFDMLKSNFKPVKNRINYIELNILR